MKYIYFSIIFFAINSIAFASDIETIYLKEAPKPDSKVFSAVKQVMADYKNETEKLGTQNCDLKIDSIYGIIETNWHRVHKGEMQRKIQIYVWGKLYRIDVWHKPTIAFFKRPDKDYRARLVEMQLQNKIEQKIKMVR